MRRSRRRMNTWSGQPLPLSGASWWQGLLQVRLSGAASETARAAELMQADSVAENPNFWEDFVSIALTSSRKPMIYGVFHYLPLRRLQSTSKVTACWTGVVPSDGIKHHCPRRKSASVLLAIWRPRHAVQRLPRTVSAFSHCRLPWNECSRRSKQPSTQTWSVQPSAA